MSNKNMGDSSDSKELPLIITSTTSTPESSRRNRKKRLSKRSTDSKSWKSDSQKTDSKSPNDGECARRKSRSVVGGSLKYEIRRNHSILDFPVKWSSVRIKGTGFDDSRKSVIRIEPCNGIPNLNLDYQHVKSPTQTHMKNNIGNVSFFIFQY